MEKKEAVQYVISRSTAGNWWVTYKDGRLAWPLPLDTRDDARKAVLKLRGMDDTSPDSIEQTSK